jgi:hypothetical protein
VLWHEYEHVKQANNESYSTKYRPDNAQRLALGEFDAHIAEITQSLRHVVREGSFQPGSTSWELVTEAVRQARTAASNMPRVEQDVAADKMKLLKRAEESTKNPDQWTLLSQETYPDEWRAAKTRKDRQEGQARKDELIQLINDMATESEEHKKHLSGQGINDRVGLERLKEPDLVKIYRSLKAL